MSRTAVVLCNLGGPDRPESVKGFLRNLFEDPAIIGLPQPWRGLLARLIAAQRAPRARAIYERISGFSPLLANTQSQATALEAVLGPAFRCFVAMRYWHPLSDAAARAVHAWRPQRVVVLPLYPQFSTTTTGSSLAAWRRAAEAAGLAVPTAEIGCYPRAPGFVAALAGLVRRTLADLPPGCRYRILFSAHGLPERIIRAGDPYGWQVEETVAALRTALAIDDLDSVVCYQSRVGPLTWIGPATIDEITRAGAEGRGLVVVPVAFVSEHSETLVELDIEYRHLAERAGVPFYRRVLTVGTEPAFIAALAELVRQAAGADGRSCCADGTPACPAVFERCLARRAA